jgi:hypothetical protein
MTKVSSNEDTNHFVDQAFMPMLFDGACIVQETPVGTTVTFDLTYPEPVRVLNMKPRPNPDCATSAFVSFSYLINGVVIPGASYYANDKTSAITTPINMDTTVVRVTVSSTGAGYITTVRDLLPDVAALNQSPVPSFGVLLNPLLSTVLEISGLTLDADGLLSSVDVFATEA